jgi:hypothetical protein
VLLFMVAVESPGHMTAAAAAAGLLLQYQCPASANWEGIICSGLPGMHQEGLTSFRV